MPTINQIEQIHKVALIVRTVSDEPLTPEAITETLRAVIHTHKTTKHFLVAQAQAEEVYRQQH